MNATTKMRARRAATTTIVVLGGLGATVAPGLAHAAMSGAHFPGCAPARPVRVLELARVRSPVLDALGQQEGGCLRVQRATRARLRHPGRFAALVIDGHTSSPAALGRRLGVMRGFLDAGSAVIAVNVGGQDYARALNALTGFQVNGERTSQALLLRMTEVGGSRDLLIEDAERLAPYGIGSLSAGRRRRLVDQQAETVGALFARQLTAGPDPLTPSPAGPSAGALVRASALGAARAAVGAGDAALPPEVQHVGWTYSEIGSWAVPQPYFDLAAHSDRIPPTFTRQTFRPPKRGTQTAEWTITHRFDVYLDNADPRSSKQVVTYELNAQFTPKRPGEQFAFMYEPFSYYDKYAGLFYPRFMERAWFTGFADVSVKPSASTETKLAHQASAPSTPNAQTTYSAGNDFQLAYGGPLGTRRGYTISTSRSYSVPDWGVANETAGNHLKWQFSARDRCDVRPHSYSHQRCFSVGVGELGMPDLPNELSRSQLPLHSSGRWDTRGLLTGAAAKLDFTLQTPVSISDLYCSRLTTVPLFIGYCDAAAWKLTRAVGGPASQTVSFNAADVIPVGLEGVTFSPASADGSKLERVKGTVALKSPARIDTNVVISSDSANAVVGPQTAGGGSLTTVVVPEGKQSANFEIHTNDNGLAAGTRTVAQITAFYGESRIAQLQVSGRKP